MATVIAIAGMQAGEYIRAESVPEQLPGEPNEPIPIEVPQPDPSPVQDPVPHQDPIKGCLAFGKAFG